MPLSGYTLPLSPNGSSALVPPPPWHFSGEVLMAEYRADPAATAAFMPDGFEPDPDGRAALIFGAWQSCTDGGEELVDPIRSQYNELTVVLAAKIDGSPVVRCAYCWVDRDFSLVRGLIQGYPKKLASIAMTTHLTVGRAGPRLAAGERFGATAAAAHHRLAELRVTLEAPAASAPALMTDPLVHTRAFPPWDPNGGAVDELVTGGSTDQEVADVWSGAAEIELLGPPGDDLALLAPVEVLGGWRLSFAETLVGGRLVAPTSTAVGTTGAGR